MLSWRKRFSCFSNFLIQTFSIWLFCQIKLVIKGLTLEVLSVAPACLCVQQHSGDAALQCWGLENAATSEFRFSLGEEKAYLLSYPGLSGSNGFSTYNFFLSLEFFFPCWFHNLSMRPFWHHWILNYRHSVFHYSLHVLGQKILGGVNLSWTSGCRYLQEERNTFFAVFLSIY